MNNSKTPGWEKKLFLPKTFNKKAWFNTATCGWLSISMAFRSVSLALFFLLPFNCQRVTNDTFNCSYFWFSHIPEQLPQMQHIKLWWLPCLKALYLMEQNWNHTGVTGLTRFSSMCSSVFRLWVFYFHHFYVSTFAKLLYLLNVCL